MDDIKINVINADLPKQCLEMVRSIYQHPQTNQHTKHVIRFELQKILGSEYDVRGFLRDKSPL